MKEEITKTTGEKEQMSGLCMHACMSACVRACGREGGRVETVALPLSTFNSCPVEKF